MYDLKVRKLLYSKRKLSCIFDRNCAVNQTQEITITKIVKLFSKKEVFFSSIIFSYPLRFKGEIDIIYKYPNFK